MKLYVWNKDVFENEYSGIAFALATSEEEARELICKEAEIKDEWRGIRGIRGLLGPADEVRDVDQLCAFYSWGPG